VKADTVAGRKGRPSSSNWLVLAALVLAGCAGGRVGAPQAGPPPAVPPAPVAPAAATAAETAWQHDWVRGAVFYEVFVRSFADSDGDGIGDLRGLTARLDYLNDGDPSTSRDLGVDALWLMPVFESPSYHGYDAVDYERIDREYGSEEDFDRLLAEAHRRGIRVILDLVVNHTGREHPWFVEAASSPQSPRRHWYVWRDDDPGWTQPWGGSNRTWHEHGGAFYYGVFWAGMPDLNYDHPEVRAEMKRIAEAWLRRGVDGFRLDATRHLFAEGPGELQNDRPRTHAFLRELAAHVRAVRPDALLVGENWTTTPLIATYYGDTSRLAGGDELPMSFDFPLAEAIVAGARGGDAAGIAAKLAEIAAVYPPGVLDAPFLTNHDQIRLATQLGGDPGKLCSAAAVLLTLPGAPFLYYGEEIGMENGPGRRDEEKRTPMPWDASPGGGFTTGTPWHPFAPGQQGTSVATQDADPESLLHHYRGLIRLRDGSPALRRGELELLSDPGHPGPVLAFVRRAAEEAVLVVHNVGAEPAASEPLPFAAEQLTAPSWGGGEAAVEPAEGGSRVRLPAHGTAVFRLPAGR
jgi:alpha-amylase